MTLRLHKHTKSAWGGYGVTKETHFKGDKLQLAFAVEGGKYLLVGFNGYSQYSVYNERWNIHYSNIADTHNYMTGFDNRGYNSAAWQELLLSWQIIPSMEKLYNCKVEQSARLRAAFEKITKK